MAETWPPQLQETFNVDGFTYTYGTTVIRSKSDVGPDKVRRISTRPVNRVQGTIWLTYDEKAIFDTFYNTTIAGGSKTFEYEDPFTQTLTIYRFVSDPIIRPIGSGGRNYSVSLDLEIMP